LRTATRACTLPRRQPCRPDSARSTTLIPADDASPVGFIRFDFDRERTPAPDEVGFPGTLARLCARALGRARLFEAQREAREVLARSHPATRAAGERVQLALSAGVIVGTCGWDDANDRYTLDARFSECFGPDPSFGGAGVTLGQAIASGHPDDLAMRSGARIEHGNPTPARAIALGKPSADAGANPATARAASTHGPIGPEPAGPRERHGDGWRSDLRVAAMLHEGSDMNRIRLLRSRQAATMTVLLATLGAGACSRDDDPVVEPPPIVSPSPPQTPGTPDTPGPPVTPTLPARAAIDVGGIAPITTVGGLAYAADAHVTGGAASSTLAPVAGTPDDGLYQSERRGEFAYAIPLADGAYRVTLQLAERTPGVTGPGQRVFDVVVEAGEAGEQRIADLDVHAAVGPNAAHEVTRTVEVRGGVLNLATAARTGEPAIAAITAVPASEPPIATDLQQALRGEVLRRLAGSASITCTDAPGTIERFEVGDGFIVFGNRRHEAGAIDRVQLTATDGRSLDVVAEGPVASDRFQFAFTLGTEGRLESLTARLPDDQGVPLDRHCVPTGPAAWGVYDGDARSFVDGIDTPRPAYPGVVMDCRWQGAGPEWNGRMSVSYTAHLLKLEPVSPGGVGTASGAMWQDPALVATPPFHWSVSIDGESTTHYTRGDANLIGKLGRTNAIAIDRDRGLVSAGIASMPVVINCLAPSTPESAVTR
jgi:hypothetical protein